MEFEFWNHCESGNTYAVALNDSQVIGAYGPITPEEFNYDLLVYFEYSDPAWINENLDSFLA